MNNFKGFQNIINKEGCVIYNKNYFKKDYFESINKDKNWEIFNIKLYGKTIPQPRESMYMADNEELTYTYSRIKRTPVQFSPEILQIKKELNKLIGEKYEKLNAVLGNKYRNGKDYISAHCDDEKDMKKNSLIVSVSFGVERDFIFKNKKTKEKIKLKLESGSVLIMDYETQKYWTHELPKRLREKNCRINLTFRTII